WGSASNELSRLDTPYDALLPVLDQNLVAALADAGAVFLQAGEHGLVAVIHHLAAVTRDIARAGVVAGLLLRRSHRGQNEKRNDQNKSGHLVLTDASMDGSNSGMPVLSMHPR